MFMLLVIVTISMIVANRFQNNTFYLLSLFGWLAYLMTPIREDIQDIKIEIKRIKKCHKNKS